MVIMEAVFDIFMSESEIVGAEINESSLNDITIAQLLTEITEEEIREDIEKKRNAFQKIKEKIKLMLKSPFDPYGGLKELKAVNELIKDAKIDVFIAIIPFIGIFVFLLRRMLKYKNYPENVAKEYLQQAKEHQSKLEKIYESIKNNPDKKYQKAATRIRKQITLLKDLIRAFERRAIDKKYL